jgi:hypothetical protein
LEKFITKAIADATKKIEPIFGEIYWYLSVDYKPGEAAFLMGYSENNDFVELSIYQDGERQIRFYEGREAGWVIQDDL